MQEVPADDACAITSWYLGKYVYGPRINDGKQNNNNNNDTVAMQQLNNFIPALCFSYIITN